MPLIIGGAAIGAGAYLLFRSRAQAAPLPSTVTTTPSRTPLSPPAPSTPTITETAATVGPNGEDPSPALVARLRQSQDARNIFAVQALAYSYNYTDAVPDGIQGPVTTALLQQLTGSATFGPNTLQDAQFIIDSSPSGQFGARVLPFTLPNDLIQSINSTIASYYPQGHLLQVLPQISSPAGQVMPYASYSRIPSVLPGNTVGANPGYGVITDPWGLNMGLWQGLAGDGFFSPSGVVQADLNMNPIAGQDGGYFMGYPGVTPGILPAGQTAAPSQGPSTGLIAAMIMAALVVTTAAVLR